MHAAADYLEHVANDTLDRGPPLPLTRRKQSRCAACDSRVSMRASVRLIPGVGPAVGPGLPGRARRERDLEADTGVCSRNGFFLFATRQARVIQFNVPTQCSVSRSRTHSQGNLEACPFPRAHPTIWWQRLSAVGSKRSLYGDLRTYRPSPFCMWQSTTFLNALLALECPAVVAKPAGLRGRLAGDCR